MRNVSTEFAEKIRNSHFMFNNCFFRNRAIYGMWKTMVQPERS